MGYTCNNPECFIGSFQKAKGCNLETCGVSQPRCPKCQYFFVQLPNKVCPKCSPATCSECEQVSDILIRVDEFACVCPNCITSEGYIKRYKQRVENLKLHLNPEAKRCARCLNKFVPQVPTQTVCNKCIFLSNRGVCYVCNKRRTLDQNGICGDCKIKYSVGYRNSNILEQGYCLCGEKEAPYQGYICRTRRCLEKYKAKLCPACTAVDPNYILPDEYICAACLTNP